MSASWAQVRLWRSAPLETAAGDLASTVQKILELGGDLERSDPGSWTGEAANGARRELAAIRELLEDQVTEIAAVRRGFLEAADAVTGVVRAVNQVEDFAQANGLAVDAAGVVSDVRGQTMFMATEHDAQLARREREALVRECVTRIDQVLRKAREVDLDLSRVLRDGVLSGRLAGSDAAGLAKAASAGHAAGDDGLFAPPAGAGTAAQNAGWWASLSEDERAQVIEKHPEWIANRDGVDYTSRDLANRVLLPRYAEELRADQARSEAELERILAIPGSEYNPRLYELSRHLGDLKDKIASVDTVQALAARPNRQILGLDLSGDRAQAIVAIGDVDTADHVAVFTPGLTSTVQGMSGYDQDMDRLQDVTRDVLRRNESYDSVATVVWQGYQAPQIDTTLTGNSVAMSGAAQDGGRGLAEFYRGMNAARESDPDLTALGHSYGSTTTGYALTEQTGVDRVAFFGSPGLGVDSLEDLQIASGGAHYGEANWDPVGDLARFGADPTSLEGMKHLKTETATAPDGTPLSGVSGHTSYLQDKSTSQWNLGAVIAGQEEDIIQGRNRGPTDFVPIL